MYAHEGVSDSNISFRPKKDMRDVVMHPRGLGLRGDPGVKSLGVSCPRVLFIITSTHTFIKHKKRGPKPPKLW